MSDAACNTFATSILREHFGPEVIGSAIGRVCGSRGVQLRLLHDTNPFIVALEVVRYTACMGLNDLSETKGERFP